jgi:hypothetical protein
VPFKKTLVLDFDGVIHSYQQKWINEYTIPDPPVPGAKEGVAKLRKKWRVLVKSTRCAISDKGMQAVKDYLAKWQIVVDGVVKTPPPFASLMVDDKVLTFRGDWSDNFLQQVDDFKPWTKA